MIETIVITIFMVFVALGLYLVNKDKKDTCNVGLERYEIYGWDYADDEDGKEPTHIIVTVMVGDDYFDLTFDRNDEFEENNQHLKF